MIDLLGGSSSASSIDAKTPSLPTADALVSVASSATTVTLLSARTARKCVIVMNDSSSALRIGTATPVTTANARIKIPANQGISISISDFPFITGIVYGIWESANGTAQVTESY
jgi:hypothetical protein